jgi:predicted small lipoprotein YifL
MNLPPAPMSLLRRCVPVLLVLAVLAGCGNKGDLVPPPPPAAAESPAAR